MKKYTLLFHLLLLSLCATAQFSGTGPANLTTPSGASSIQWYEVTDGGVAAIPGETNATYSANTSGIFYAEYTDSSQPANCQNQQTTYTFIIQEGETITLDGSINNGSGSNYQWYNDGITIPGATSDSYAVTEGGFYQLTYDNGSCTIVSKPYYVFLIILGVDLNVSVDQSTQSAMAGEFLTYVFTLTNESAEDATGVKARALYPSNTEFVAATPSQGSYDANTKYWDLGTVSSGSQTLTITVKVK